MATRFELVLPGTNTAALRAAGDEALEEIRRLESTLSIYLPGTELSTVNARAFREPVRVSPPVFNLLRQAQRIYEETDGAFDITVAPLLRCWGFMRGTGSLPDKQALADARSKVGMDKVELDAANYTVRFQREGMMLDLGAIGKGYAIERAVQLLEEAGVQSALIHGGTSSVYGVGQPPDAEAWSIALDLPSGKTNEPARRLAVVPLKNTSLSVSAVWGKSFESGGQTYGHIIDPRTGEPSQQAVYCAIVLASATEADALTTALLVAGVKGFQQISTLRHDLKSLVVCPGKIPERPVIKTSGIVLAK